jgi:hypothetical protein
VLLATGPGAFAQTEVKAGTAHGEPGDTVQIPVSIIDPGQAAALQFEISYDSTMLNLGTVAAGWGLVLSSHTFDSDVPSPGFLRVLVQSSTNQKIFGGEMVSVPFTIPKDAEFGFLPLVLSGVVMGDPNGTPLAAGIVTGGGIDVTPFACPEGMLLDLEVKEETIAGALGFQACRAIIVSTDVVVESGGELLLEAGQWVEFRNGLTVEDDAVLTVVIADPFSFDP